MHPSAGFALGVHPHNRARSTFIDVKPPATTPRFSRTPAEVRSPPPVANESGATTLAAWGFAAVEIDALRAAGVLA